MSGTCLENAWKMSGKGLCSPLHAFGYETFGPLVGHMYWSRDQHQAPHKPATATPTGSMPAREQGEDLQTTLGKGRPTKSEGFTLLLRLLSSAFALVVAIYSYTFMLYICHQDG